MAELLADALDEGAHVGPVAVGAVAGHEVLAAHDVVDLPVGDVAALLGNQEEHDGKLGQREIDLLARPESAADDSLTLQRPVSDYSRFLAAARGGRLPPPGEQPHAP